MDPQLSEVPSLLGVPTVSSTGGTASGSSDSKGSSRISDACERVSDGGKASDMEPA